jgi:AGCS family alanine or glycine:cation symporter
VQSSAASESLNVCFQIPKIQTGVVIAIVTLLLVYGGRERVSRFSSAVIPILCLAYVIISIAIIISNISLIPEITLDIISNAFNAESCGGGFLGIMTSKAFRFGASRGVLSNEAGCGTICYAHSNSSGSPAKQGVWGMIEVFIDTILLCTLTALVIILSKEVPVENAMNMVISAFEYFLGSFGKYFVGLSCFFFALATICTQYFYGSESISFITKSRAISIAYTVIFSSVTIIGAIIPMSVMWEISDLILALMTIFNLICLIALFKDTKNEC